MTLILDCQCGSPPLHLVGLNCLSDGKVCGKQDECELNAKGKEKLDGQRLTSKLVGVLRGGPLSLLDHGFNSLLDLWSSSNNFIDGELVKGSGILNVLERCLEVFEFSLNFV